MSLKFRTHVQKSGEHRPIFWFKALLWKEFYECVSININVVDIGLGIVSLYSGSLPISSAACMQKLSQASDTESQASGYEKAMNSNSHFLMPFGKKIHFSCRLLRFLQSIAAQKKKTKGRNYLSAGALVMNGPFCFPWGNYWKIAEVWEEGPISSSVRQQTECKRGAIHTVGR